jgi:hypothetical protein
VAVDGECVEAEIGKLLAIDVVRVSESAWSQKTTRFAVDAARLQMRFPEGWPRRAGFVAASSQSTLFLVPGFRMLHQTSTASVR